MDTIEKKTTLTKRFLAFFASLAVLASGALASAPAAHAYLPGAGETGQVTVEKVDENDKPLAGAHLQILAKDGQAVEDFTTDGTPQKFTLPVGDYKLHEVSAPKGYKVAKDKPFTVGGGTIIPPAELPGIIVDKDVPGGEQASVHVVLDENGNQPSWPPYNYFINDEQGREVVGFCSDSHFYGLGVKNQPPKPYTAYKYEDKMDLIPEVWINGYPAEDMARNLLRVLYAGVQGQAYEANFNYNYEKFKNDFASEEDFKWLQMWRATQYAVTWHTGSSTTSYWIAANTDKWGGVTWNQWKKKYGLGKDYDAYVDSLIAAFNDESLDAQIAEVGYNAIAYYSGWQVNIAATFGSKTNNTTVTMKDLPEGKAEIGTTATDGTTGEHIGLAAENTVLKDVVAYSDLTPGAKYTVKGQLMKRADSSVIEGATAEATFTASETGSGEVELTFTYDATKLAGFASVAFEELYDVNGTLVAEHKDIKDEGQTVYYPEAQTSASDQDDGDKDVSPVADAQVKDVVTYKNLIPGKEYTVKGQLVKKSDGKTVVATAETTFTPTTKGGTVELVFTFDATKLVGEKLVAFEKVLYNEDVVAVHEDINDEEQTVEVNEKPKIGTTAVDSETGDHIAKADESVTIVDTVAYKNLVPGTEYTLKGQLVKKSDQSVVTTAEKKFTPTAANGTVKLSFTFDGSALEGTSVVAFERVYLGEEEVAVHADINDANQTVDFPKAKTNASDKDDSDQILAPDAEVTVVDVVTYSNLIKGKEYTVSGVLMDKETGKELLVNGQQVTAEKTFKANAKNGSVTLEFTFDASALNGKTLVVFETVSYQGKEVAVHADINDKDQTVKVTDQPEIGTTATDNTDNDQKVAAEKDAVVKDVVKYVNLKPGTEYTLKGQLVKKSDESVLAEAQTTFTPKAASGEVELTFTFDASAFAGEKAVAFERVYLGEEEVAVHADINDKGQTVDIVKPGAKTTASDNADGDKVIEPAASQQVKDVVRYTNLSRGKEYTLTGKLVKKSDQSVVAEKTITFKANEISGTVTLVFDVDASALAGEELVAFETVSYGGVDVVVHADINDEAQTVNVKDAPEVVISKVDAATSEELPGAKLTITKKGETTPVDSWTSTSTPHKVKLAPGEYTLTETTAPDGYDVAEFINFTVDENGLVGSNKVVMKDKPTKEKPTPAPTETEDSENPTVEISKVDATTSEELPGAQLTVTKAGEFVDSWTSGTESHKIQLAPGEYTLTEVQAPEWYDIAESINFTVDENGLVGGDKVVMKDEHNQAWKDAQKELEKKDVTPPEENTPTPEETENLPKKDVDTTPTPDTPQKGVTPAANKPLNTTVLSKTGATSVGLSLIAAMAMVSAGGVLLYSRRREQ